MSTNHALRRERELRGWSQAKMAEEVGTTLNTISSWERGLATPSPYFRQRLCTLLHKNAFELGFVMDAQDQSEPTVSFPIHNSNRHRFLTKVRTFWIKGVLEQSAPRTSFIAVTLREHLEAVGNPWHGVLQQPEKKPHSLASGSHIVQVYNEAGGELLILGQPGSGKTTLLLRLASELLERAERDEEQLMPVVLNLSSWTKKHTSLAHWLVEELHSRYQVPYQLGKTWVDGEQILPLLDGLDEVSIDLRALCLDAINAYRKEHGLVPFVVCSRKDDYLAIGRQLLLQEAIEIEPLTSKQVDEYLQKSGVDRSEGIESLLSHPEFQEVTTTPLMLTIMAQTYNASGKDVFFSGQTPQEARRALLCAYVEQMLMRRGRNDTYQAEGTIIWLRWLAQQLRRRSQMEFYLEWMQSDWLPSDRIRLRYHTLVVIISGLLLGIISGLACALIAYMLGGEPYPTVFSISLVLGVMSGVLAEWIYWKGENRKETQPPLSSSRSGFKRGWIAFTTFGLIFFVGFSGFFIIFTWQVLVTTPLATFIVLFLAFVCGLMGGLISGLSAGLGLLKPPCKEIMPAEVVSWSWSSLREHAWKNLGKGLGFGFACGLVFAIILTVEGWQVLGPQVGLVVGLIDELVTGLGIGVIAGLLAIVTGGLAQDRLPKRSRVKPNEGIWRSMRNALLIGGISGPLGGLLFGLLNQLIAWLVFELSFSVFGPMITIQGGPVGDLSEKGLVVGLFSSVIIGLIAGLRNGGMACIQHLILRLLLWRTGSIPWNYERFLDYAAERILLRKVGGGYIFLHRVLLEYFADGDDPSSPSVSP